MGSEEGPSFSTERAIIISIALFISGFVGAVGGNLLGVLIVSFVDLSSEQELFVPSIFTFFGIATPTFGYVILFQRDLSYFDFYWPTKKDLVVIIAGTLVTIGVLVFMNLFTYVIGIEGVDHPFITEVRGDLRLLIFLSMIVITVNAPIEELFFRNVIQKRLATGTTRWVGVFCTSFLFMSFHIPTLLSVSVSLGVIPSLITLFFVSIVFGVVYEETRNILTPITVHALYNLTQLTILAISTLATTPP